MLSIAAGIHDIWPQFSLEMDSELVFQPGNLYFLDGANGSGKSSLLQGLLLSKLSLIKDSVYRLYLPQFTAHQNFAIRAHAAMLKHPILLQSDLDCLNYLLDDLRKVCLLNPRPVYMIVDESLHLSNIYNFLMNGGFTFCLIYSQHGHNPLLSQSRIIRFQPVFPQLSKVYESSI